jgi:hypothetical protein
MRRPHTPPERWLVIALIDVLRGPRPRSRATLLKREREAMYLIDSYVCAAIDAGRYGPLRETEPEKQTSGATVPDNA